MARVYTPSTMVTLPRLNAARAVTLTESMLTQAQAEREKLQASGRTWPDLLVEGASYLEAALVELKEAMKPAEEDTAAAVDANYALDHAWSSFKKWCDSTLEQPDDAASELPQLRGLCKNIFSDGLEFLRQSHAEEYAESGARLAVIDDEGYGPVVDALGGSWFLATLREAHAALGEAIHATRPIQEQATGRVGERYTRVLDALRWWVLKVVALTDPEVPDSSDFAASLLLPLTQWENPESGNKSEAGSEETTATE